MPKVLEELLGKLLGNKQALNAVGTAFIFGLMAYCAYAVLKANVVPVAAYLCFIPAALAAVVVALISGFGREDRIAELPYALQLAIKGYNVLAPALIGSALMYLFAVVILPLVLLSTLFDKPSS